METSFYIEQHAKQLVKELADAWSREKAFELKVTLIDLENESKPVAKIDEIEKITPIKEIKPLNKITKPAKRLRKGERQAIIDLILDRFFEESKSGKRDFVFYGKDFGVSGEYLQRNIFNLINTNAQKQKRFPDLRIRTMYIPDGVSCHIGRKDQL